jgi:glycosyltransferase involved in cell wall biosynthesis
MVITAVVCTRDRPDSTARAVRSLLQSRDVELKVIVVDQSDDDATVCRLMALRDSRVKTVRTAKIGKPSAFNTGLRMAASPLVVITDDDCEVPPDWVAGMAAAFAGRPDVAMVFSNVVAADYDRHLGYVPTYERGEDRRVGAASGDARKGQRKGMGPLRQTRP